MGATDSVVDLLPITCLVYRSLGYLDPWEGESVMNAVDQVLSADMTDLLDRLAASVPGGSLTAISAMQPTLRKRLDEMEDHLTTARAALLDGYGRWRRALEDIESLWALGVYRIDGMEGRDMAPHTPRRSEHPGEAGLLLGNRAASSSAAEETVEPARSIAA